MNDDIKNIFLHLREDLELTLEERSHMRSELERRMSAPATVMVAIPSPFAFLFNPAQAFAFLLLLVMVSGGSAAWAAEGALPGDTLYSMKLGVNERLERVLAVSSHDKADIEVRQAQERLQEVELLAANGDIEETTLDEAAAKVEEHIARADEAAKSLLSEGDEAAADAVHARITSALSTHADILRSQSEDADDDEQRSLRLLALAVENAAGHAEDSQNDDIPNIEDDARAERLAMSRAASVEATIKKFEEALSVDGVAKETQQEFQDEFSSIQASFTDAASLLAEGEFEDAADAYEELEGRTYRSLILLSSAKRIQDDTDKEVLVTLEKDQEIVADTASSTAENAPMLMTMQAKIAAPEAKVMETRREPFRFKVRDRRGED